ncbi:MAG: hypothetical protein JETCAE03_34420 [Ignavibacteriaceae bacterium]|jgi:hypothetical protein|nr:MAG: hypothetical protein JETCAE03_34420 [Ignavibacteriaceae bacterium]
MTIESIVVDFCYMEKAELAFYQMETQIAASLYFTNFFIDENNEVIPTQFLPDVAIIFIN